MNLRSRYESKVNRNKPDCHPWIAGCDSHGYGRMKVNGRNVGAHRIGWELIHGPIPPGKRILHSCDNPPCQNPDHWFLGSQLDNMQDMAQKKRSGTRHSTNLGTRKLSDAEVAEIRASSESGSVLAAQFGVSRSHISRLKNRLRRR